MSSGDTRGASVLGVRFEGSGEIEKDDDGDEDADDDGEYREGWGELGLRRLCNGKDIIMELFWGNPRLLLSTPVALTIPPKVLDACLAPAPVPVPEPSICCCEPVENSIVKNDYVPEVKSMVIG